MRKQQVIWEKEHTDSVTIKGMQPVQPSSFVVSFYAFLQKRNISHGDILDIGCGKGRNAIFLASKGYKVVGIDYSQAAINFAKKQAKIQHTLVSFLLEEIDKPWPFPDNMFDVAIDCFSSIDIETHNGREIYREELLRTLKPGGYALIVVVAANDMLEKEMIQNSPGKEKNSSIWPSGKYQKNYDEEEIKQFYKAFKIIEFKTLEKPAEKLGKMYMATNYWMVLQK